MQKFGQLVNAELWKLQKSGRTRLMLITMVLLPWAMRLMGILALKTDAKLAIVDEHWNWLMYYVVGMITAILTISDLGLEFESDTFKTLILQGVTRWQVLLAKSIAIVAVSVLLILVFGLSIALTLENLSVAVRQAIQVLVPCALISFAYTGLIFAVSMLGRSSISIFFGLLVYLADVAMSILTPSVPPMAIPLKSSWLTRFIWGVAPFSISFNSSNLAMSTTILSDALPEICLLILFGVTGIAFSMLVFSRQDLK